MRDLSNLAPERLLSINKPEALFSNSVPEAHREYRLLARRWHPDIDKSPMATPVFAHIVHLYEEARRKLEDGEWVEPAEKIEKEVPGLKRFRLLDGSIKEYLYIASRPFELGTMYIGDNHVVYEVRNEFRDLYSQGRAQIRGLKFIDRQMAVEMSTYLPASADSFRTAESSVLVLKKTPDQLLLADVLAYLGGRMTQIEHVGWILNVLYNIACYLEWSEIAHNAISAETVFISPLRHSGVLLGGWWYALPLGSQIKALPDETLTHAPPDVLSSKKADVRIDLELIRSLGRQMLGDASGAELRYDTTIPTAISQWLCLPSGGLATSDYAEWKYDVLPSVFGKPKFVDLKIRSTDLYKEF